MNTDKNITETKKTKSQIKKEQILSLLQQADEQNLEIYQQDTTNKTTGESFKDLYELSLQKKDFKEGDVVKGTVISIENDFVMVDINYKSEGIVSKSEFRIIEGQKDIEVGHKLDVYIDRIENDSGMMVLSKDRADIIRIWKDIAKIVENEEIIEGTVINKVKGGLSVDIGVKAFLPGSQIDLRPVRDLNGYVGKKFKFKVIKFNQKRGNIVLSRRVLLNQGRQNNRSIILADIKEGSTVKGVVKNITDYGVFLDLGGLDGLLHITDMSWNRIKHPSEIVNLGDEIDIKILKFDKEKSRVSLGLKQLTTDPWDVVSKDINIGDIIKAKVVSLTDYGAFMRLSAGVEGLVHISEMSWGKKIKYPSQLLNIDDEIDVKILGIDKDNHRISLGIKQLQENPWLVLKEKYTVGTKLTVTVKSMTDFGVFVTIEGEEMDGFIHISDLSWIEHIVPKTHYKKGDVLDVVVRDISIKEEHFNLSIKHLQDDPWVNISSKYPPGSRHEVIVKTLMDFGVFVELEPGIEGLIHVSELSTEFADNFNQSMKIGDSLKVEVLNIDLEARKIGLSVKQVQLRGDKEALEFASESTATVTAKKSDNSKNKNDSFFGRILKASLNKNNSTESTDSAESTLESKAESTEESTVESKADSIESTDSTNSKKD